MTKMPLYWWIKCTRRRIHE